MSRGEAMGAVAETSVRSRAAQNQRVLQAIQRKERSERILLSEGVPVNAQLPLTEVAESVVPRDKEEIALRALCVLMTAIKSERMDQSMVLRVIRQYGLAAHFSPVEREFIRNPEPSAKHRTRFSWRYESAWVLLWALGYVKTLNIPNAPCDVATAVACMRDRKTQTFIDDAKLRPFEQIVDQADLIYRYHRALVDVALSKGGFPANLNASIVYERHYALNWLIRHADQEWDDVSADT